LAGVAALLLEPEARSPEDLLAAGDRLAAAGNSEQALKTWRYALARATAPTADDLRSRIHYFEGVYAAGQDDLARASALFEQSLAEARRVGNRQREGRALHALGNMAIRRNEFSRAKELYRVSLRIAEEVRDERLLMLSHRGLGDAAAQLGHNDEALRSFEAALALARRRSDHHLIEGTLNSMGSIHLELADYGRALQYFQEALQVGPDDPHELSYLLNNLGIVYGRQGLAGLGLEHFQRALRVAEEVGDDYSRVRVLNNLGEVHQARGRYELAREHFTRALRLAEAAGDRHGMIGHWHNLGTVSENQGRLAAAADEYRKSLELAESLGGRNLVSQALRGMASVALRRDDYRQAAELADRAATTAAETGSRETFWQARTLAGHAHSALGQAEEARRAFSEAIASIEQVRDRLSGAEVAKESFFEGRLEPYEGLVTLAAERGEPAEALVLAERAKGRSLLEILRQGRVDLASRLAPAERSTEQRLRDRLAAVNGEVFVARSRPRANPAALRDLERRLQAARQELEAFVTNLYASRPGLRTRRAEFPAWSAESARGLLAGDTALIEYAVLPDRTYLFVITAEEGSVPRVRFHRLPVGREELSREVEAFRVRLAARDLDFREPARRLYDLLLAPAAAEIRNRRTLCIVPDGPLWDLPFQALQMADSALLLERHALFLAPSLNLLVELAARRAHLSSSHSRSATLLAIGNPEPGAGALVLANTLRSGLSRLPEAEREVRSLARLYGAGRSAVYTAAMASEERVKAEAGRYRVLHFATHALLDDRNPMYSSLVLSQARQARGEDGLLEAWELLGLRLNADLVVLSACQTARGRPRAGEGMIGMSWAFAAAGSPATLASQWEVDSASTSRLMVEFHREWLAGLDKAEALRRAALAVRSEERYRHPFYWAGFVLVGDGG
jgi:CHAT domain-containing protein